MPDDMRRQHGKFGRECEVGSERGSTRSNQGDARFEQCRNRGIAQRFPVSGIAIGELAIVTEHRNVGDALGIIERERAVAEIAMQDRPQRIVVVHDPHGRQAAAQRVEAVPDQRRNDDRIDRLFAQQFVEQRAIAGVGNRGVGDCDRQRNAPQRWTRHRTVVDFEPFAVPLALVAAARNEHAMPRMRE